MPGDILHRKKTLLTSEATKIDLYLIAEEDIPYEEELIRNPFTLQPWLRYLQHKTDRPLHETVFVLERACRELPGSYKLWKMYLDLRVRHLGNLNPAKYEEEYSKVNDAFERALVLLNKMPRIWIMYLTHLMKQCKITHTRRSFDNALRSLPLTQHDRIWKLYLEFAKSASGPTAIRIWKRYMQVQPELREDFIDVLHELNAHSEAARQYMIILNQINFKSRHGKSNYQQWSEFAELLVSYPHDIDSDIPVERIIRTGIERFSDQRGTLWTSLATYWITLQDFERARDAFEEGMTTVMTVRDFTQIFDAYAEFEESIISEKMEEAAKRENVDPEADFDLDIRMMRFEQLMDRRPFLVNDVLLRQNPNNVVEWEKRVGLWGENKTQVVATYTDAIKTINPKHAAGRFGHLWVQFAKFYEEGGDLKTAREIMEKATRVGYRSVNELADVWIDYAEMEIRADNMDKALEIMALATKAPRISNVDYFDETLTPQARVHKSSKLWSFYVDLEESCGTVESTKAIYERIFELRIATPQIIVNYANFLEEHKYYEESFRIYERGVDHFSYPVAFELWNLYLTKFLARYGGTKLERARDLFEQALNGCPPKFAKPLYLLYGNLEEQYGLARHAMRIYDRATKAVSDEDRFEMFDFYITKSATGFGITSTRPIYEKAIEVLPDKEAKEMCLRFANMERRIGEIDRARAIYAHGSQFADPRTSPAYWEVWHAFEVKHGNEDTFKEMLRIKRSVLAQYNTDAGYVAAASGQTGGNVDGAQLTDEGDPMAALEKNAPLSGFVESSTGPVGGRLSAPEENGDAVEDTPMDNPDAIELGDDEDQTMADD